MTHATAVIARITGIAATAAHIAAAAAAVLMEAMVVVAAARVHEIAAPEVPNEGPRIIAGAGAIHIASVVAIHWHRRGLVGR
jgi:hypothetical protein